MSEFTTQQRATLLALAARSIQYGLHHGRPLPVETNGFEPALRAPRACFITLHIHHQLRGCIGSLQPQRPLVEDVAHNAFAAAFADPRFPPLHESEYPRLEIDISVLQLPIEMDVRDEADLLTQLRPGVDGLILQDRHVRATFLPSVWEQLPSAETFLSHLKRKAGLASDYWSPGIRFSRYETESFATTTAELST